MHDFSAERDTHGMNVVGMRRDFGFAGGEGGRLSRVYMTSDMLLGQILQNREAKSRYPS